MAPFSGEFIAGIVLTVVGTVVLATLGITICCIVRSLRKDAANAAANIPPPAPQQQQQQQQQPPGYQSLNVVTETRGQRIRNFFRRTPAEVPIPRDG